MQKDFDSWNNLKKRLEEKESDVFCNPREIWWASIGLNIGSEEDGKNHLFERPVLILKVFNRNMIRVIPLTSKPRSDVNHFRISHATKETSLILSQLRTVSPKRLTRKIGRLESSQFNMAIAALKKSFEWT